MSVHPRRPAGPLRARTSPAELVLLPPGLDRGLLPTPAQQQQQRLSAEAAQPAARAASNVLDELGGRRPTQSVDGGRLGPAPPQRRRPWSWPARARCRGVGRCRWGAAGAWLRAAGGTAGRLPRLIADGWPLLAQRRLPRPLSSRSAGSSALPVPQGTRNTNRRSHELPPHPPSGGAKDAYARGPPGAPGGTGDQLGGRAAWYVPWTASGAT